MLELCYNKDHYIECVTAAVGRKRSGSGAASCGLDWSQAIRQLPEDKATQERLLILLAQFMVQKFSHLSRKEITKMLKLTPIEETVAGQEWLQEGHIEMLVELIEEKFGEPASKLTSRLSRLTNKDLKALGRYLLKTESYKEVEAWIEGRLTVLVNKLP